MQAQLPLFSYRSNMLGKTRLDACMEEKKVATVTVLTNAKTGIKIFAIDDPEVSESHHRLTHMKGFTSRLLPSQVEVTEVPGALLLCVYSSSGLIIFQVRACH